MRMITTKQNQQAQKRHITHHYVINNKNETSTLTKDFELAIEGYKILRNDRDANGGGELQFMSKIPYPNP